MILKGSGEIGITNGFEKTGQKNVGTLQELDQKLKKGIASLPPKCQQIFLLSRQNGLNNKEIANKLNISLSTVENQKNDLHDG